jgi:high-affinity iron transporter
VHEFQEAGILPETVEHLWNTNAMVSEDSHLGKFLTALFGYNGDPSALEVGVWFTYLSVTLVLFLRPLISWRREPAPAQA